MWCSNCQQDVPAVGESGTARLHCSRCQGTLRPPHAVAICEEGIALDEEPVLVMADDRPPLVADAWQFERQSRELGRKLRVPIGKIQRRLDGPEDTFDGLVQATATPAIQPASYAQQRRVDQAAKPESGQFVAWLVTLLGLATLASGLGGLVWTVAHGGGEYWDIALVVTMAGQGLLIFGLVLVVMRLWRHSRYASARLQHVHHELGQLQRTADALSAMRSGGAPVFYGELVRGASPQMLLTNLKGQLDQLATRLGNG